MPNVTLTVDRFLQDFPEFSSVDHTLLQGYINRAVMYVSSYYNNTCITADQRLLMIELMTAHITTITSTTSSSGQATTGAQANGYISSSHIHDVSISKTPPPIGDNLEYWLSLSSYGLQLLALFSSFPNVTYFGGSQVRALS